jgi:hypothetical protein
LVILVAGWAHPARAVSEASGSPSRAPYAAEPSGLASTIV